MEHQVLYIFRQVEVEVILYCTTLDLSGTVEKTGLAHQIWPQ